MKPLPYPVRWVLSYTLIIPLVFVVHWSYIWLLRTCVFMGWRPPKPWLR